MKLSALLLGLALALPLSARADLSGDSLYQLQGQFTDQTGAKVGLDAFRGHPVLISMFYGSCHGACPMLISKIQRLEESLPAAKREKVRVVLVSFDPEHDTESSLGALFQAHRLDAARWKFLRTDPEKVQELAAILGIKYRFAPDGSINHSSVITLLDENGVVQTSVDGADQPADAIANKL